MQAELTGKWEGQPSPSPIFLSEEAETRIEDNLARIAELKEELIKLEEEIEEVEAEELNIAPAEGEEVTYDGMVPVLEEELITQRAENGAIIKAITKEIEDIRKTGVLQ